MSTNIGANLKMITQRVHQMHGGRNTTVGVFVGFVANNRVYVGWSRVNFVKGDTFDMNRGITEAINCAFLFKNLPRMSNFAKQNEFVEFFKIFQKRCARYFKGIPFAIAAPTADFAPVKVDPAIFESMKKVLAPLGIQDDQINRFLEAATPIMDVLKNRGIVGLGVPMFPNENGVVINAATLNAIAGAAIDAQKG